MAKMKKNGKPQPTGPRPESYTWMMTTDSAGKSVVHCYKANRGGQHYDLLWEPSASDFHDEGLARATKEINAITRRIVKENKDPDRRLAFIEFQSRLMLVWSRYGGVGPEGDLAETAKALGLGSTAIRDA